MRRSRAQRGRRNPGGSVSRRTSKKAKEVISIDRIKELLAPLVPRWLDFDSSGAELVPDLRPCVACRGRRFWKSFYGASICARCHPPADPSLVAEELEAPYQPLATKMGLPSATKAEARRRNRQVFEIALEIRLSQSSGAPGGVPVHNSHEIEDNMKIAEMYPGKYLKADDLGGRPVTHEMSSVASEVINGETKVVVHFRGMKQGFVLNKTNAQIIESAYGGETDNWIGRKITLYPDKTPFQGKVVPCIRVRLPEPTNDDELLF